MNSLTLVFNKIMGWDVISKTKSVEVVCFSERKYRDSLDNIQISFLKKFYKRMPAYLPDNMYEMLSGESSGILL